MLTAEIPNFKNQIQKQASSISMRDYENKVTNTTKFVIVNLYFLDTLKDAPTLAKVLMKVYLIENLKVNILIKTNILISYKFLLDYNSQA